MQLRAVAPFTGAWIEIPATRLYLTCSAVAPYIYLSRGEQSREQIMYEMLLKIIEYTAFEKRPKF